MNFPTLYIQELSDNIDILSRSLEWIYLNYTDFVPRNEICHDRYRNTTYIYFTTKGYKLDDDARNYLKNSCWEEFMDEETKETYMVFDLPIGTTKTIYKS